MLGFSFTLIVILAVALQLLLLYPVTMYVEVSLGITDTELPLPKPLLHTYVFAPETIKVLFSPLHIVDGTAAILNCGIESTTTFVDALLVHPAALITVTL